MNPYIPEEYEKPTEVPTIPDCTAVSQFLERCPAPRLDYAMEEVPRLVECLQTHEQVVCAPRSSLPSETRGLKALGLNLFGAMMSEVVIIDGRLRGCNLTDVKAFGILAVRTTFIGCYIHGADFAEGAFLDCHFVGCEISKNDFRDTNFEGTRFRDCDIYGNWARRASGLVYQTPQSTGEEFGFEDQPPWELGVCDGHELTV